jgi:hypothetical protein
MCLGVRFIAPRQLGAVGVPFVRPWLPYVHGRSPVHHRTMNSARFPSLFGEDDHCQPLVPWRTGQSGGTPDSLVLPVDRWLSHVSPADRVVDRW